MADFERIHKEYLSRLPHVARIRSIFVMRTVYKIRDGEGAPLKPVREKIAKATKGRVSADIPW